MRPHDVFSSKYLKPIIAKEIRDVVDISEATPALVSLYSNSTFLRNHKKTIDFYKQKSSVHVQKKNFKQKNFLLLAKNVWYLKVIGFRLIYVVFFCWF